MSEHVLRYCLQCLIVAHLVFIADCQSTDECRTLTAQPNVQFTNGKMLVQYSNVSMVECLDFCCQYDECHAITYTGFLHSSSGLNCILYPCVQNGDTSGPCAVQPTLNQLDQGMGVLTAFLQRDNAQSSDYSDVNDDQGVQLIPNVQVTARQHIFGEIQQISRTPPSITPGPYSESNPWDILQDDSRSTMEPGVLISETASKHEDQNMVEKGEAEDIAIPITVVVIVAVLLVICIIVNSVLAAAVMIRKRRRRVARGGGFEINPVYAHSPAATISSGTLSGINKPYTNTVTDSIPNYFASSQLKAYDNFYC